MSFQNDRIYQKGRCLPDTCRPVLAQQKEEDRGPLQLQVRGLQALHPSLGIQASTALRKPAIAEITAAATDDRSMGGPQRAQENCHRNQLRLGESGSTVAALKSPTPGPTQGPALCMSGGKDLREIQMCQPRKQSRSFLHHTPLQLRTSPLYSSGMETFQRRQN